MRFAPRIGVGLLAFALALTLAHCGDDDTSPSGPAPTLNAPVHLSPPSGSFVDSQPTLTIQNVTPSDGGMPSYHFQVALSNSYSAVAAEQTNVAQGTGGQTAWRVNVPLAPGTYFWRARAQASGASGPFSENDRFTATGSSAGGTILIQDVLTNGASVGSVRGGQFTPNGWQINDLDDYIRYEIPPTSSGFVEWENLGLRRTNADAEAYMMFAMWDPMSGEFRTNPFRVNIQKLDTQHNPPYVRLRFISDGDERNTGYNNLDWEPSLRYRWRVEWGPATDRNEARVFVNGIEVMQVVYTPDYEPRTHWVEMGVNESRNESCIGAVFSNVRIERR